MRYKTLRIGLLLIISAAVMTPWAMEKHQTGVTFEKIKSGPGNDWVTYAGGYTAQRHSPLSVINRMNVTRLVPQWVFKIGGDENLRVTPLVYDGVMYITSHSGLKAVEADSGREQWSYDYGGWLNRGAALWGDKVFYISNTCTIVALDRLSGQLQWQKQYADFRQKYNCTMAPLALRGRLIVGVSGGSDGARGFLAALSAEDGHELWRFWTVPEEGTLQGGATTWMTGSYDAEQNILFWATGHPWPDFNGSDRPGDNLYSDTVLALDPDQGTLRWYFQFTPHDVHGWDASEPLVLVDRLWHGEQHRLLMQANRNGFFYVLDRVAGKFLAASPFVQRLTWAEGLDNQGRPVKVPEKNRGWLKESFGVCPGLTGATNWMSSAYNPETRLFYVAVLEACDMERGHYFLRAIDPEDGRVRWEYPMAGRAGMYAGVLSTAGGLVFAGDDAGQLLALDAASGEKLWQYSTGQYIFASPMTYQIEDKQFVAIAAGSKIFTFGLNKP